MQVSNTLPQTESDQYQRDLLLNEIAQENSLPVICIKFRIWLVICLVKKMVVL